MEKNDSNNIKSRGIRQALLAILQELATTIRKTAVVLQDFSIQEDVEGLDIAYNCKREVVEREIANLLHGDAEVAQRTFELKEACRVIRDARRMFLVRLLCLDPVGTKSEHLKFMTALEGLRGCNASTMKACYSIKKLLVNNDSECFRSNGPVTISCTD